MWLINQTLCGGRQQHRNGSRRWYTSLCEIQMESQADNTRGFRNAWQAIEMKLQEIQKSID